MSRGAVNRKAISMSNIIVSHRMRAAAVTAVIVALGVVGCTTTNTPAAGPAPEVPSTVPSDDVAQAAAASLDPAFADDEVWDLAKEAARLLCDLADSDPNTAVADSLIVAEQNGVTPEQIGIMWGVATNLYCPEYKDLVG